MCIRDSQYCDNTGYHFKVKTDFTNPNLLYTQFGWSVYYDHNNAIIYGNNPPSGFTSTVTYQLSLTGSTYYVPYTMIEITQDEYDNGGYYDWTSDTLMSYVYEQPEGPFGYNMPTYYFNSGYTLTGLNLFIDCTTFATIASRVGIRIGSSTVFGSPLTNLIETEDTKVLDTEDNKNIQTQQN